MSDLYQTWTANVQYYALTAIQILSKSTKAHASYYELFKVYETKKKKIKAEKYGENKTNFEGTYLSDGWADSPQICNGKFPIPRECPEQKWLMSVQPLSSLKMAFSWFPVKYTLVCRVPALAVLAARHTIMCLD